MRGYTRLPARHAEGPLPHARRRARPVRRLDLRHDAAAVRLHARRGHLAHRRLASSCRPARARGHARHDRSAWCEILKTHPRGDAASSSSAAARRRAAWRCARRRCSSISCPRPSARCRRRRLKTIISDKLADVPDIRSWFVNERGERELSFSMLSQRRRRAERTPSRKLESALRQRAGLPQRRRRPPRSTGRSCASCRSSTPRPPRRRAERDRRDDPRRHHRRHRRQPRQVQRRRPAGADPRAARGGRAQPTCCGCRTCA